MIRTKICGMTRQKDVEVAAEFGAWAVGFVFYEKSPRFIDPRQVKPWARNLPKTIRKVGVFVNPLDEDLRRAIDLSEIDTVQLHGDESLGRIEELKKLEISLFKALRPESFEDLETMRRYQSSQAIQYCLIDSFSKGAYGGTGTPANWKVARALSEIGPIILSGGLKKENVKAALEEVPAYAIDLSSGVEDSPGVKNHCKIRDFFHLIHNRAESKL